MSVLLSSLLFLACPKKVEQPDAKLSAVVTETTEVKETVETTVEEPVVAILAQVPWDYSLAEDTTIKFVGAKVTKKHDGEFKKFSGSAAVMNGNLIALKAIIDMSSVETDHPKLTEHLKTADFFDISQFAEATFTSTKIENGQITGTLDFHGLQNEITFPAEITVEGEDVKIAANFSINRQLWSVTYPGRPDDLIKDDVPIILNAHYVK